MRSTVSSSRLGAAVVGLALAVGCAGEAPPVPPAGPDHTSKAILELRLAGLPYTVAGTIHPSEPRIDLTVPAGSDRRALRPVVTHSGVRLRPPSGVAQDFTAPVRYTVWAADGSHRTYVVRVTAASTSAPSEWQPAAWYAPAPGRIAVAADGFLVTQPRLREVWHYDREGSLRERVGVGFRATAVAVLPGDQWLLGDAERQRLVRYLPSRRRGEPFGAAAVTPNAIAVDAARGRVYVTDGARHQVVVTDLQGVERARFGAPGASPGQLRFPAGVAVDPVSGDVAVADLRNRRVTIFDGGGQFLRVVTQPETPSLIRPVGVAYDRSGRLYVADSLRSVIYRFDGDGTYRGVLGGYGTGAGQLRTPQDLVVLGGAAPSGTTGPLPPRRGPVVYVTDYRNQRITTLPVSDGEAR